jgi:hypothetical protein
LALPALIAGMALLIGCGGMGPSGRTHDRSALIVGRRAPSSRPSAWAVGLAHRFASTYARDAYLRRPPAIPGESVPVRRAVVEAASRVPPARRGLRPRLLGLRLWLLPGGSLGAAARIGGGRFPPFSVGFSVGSRGGRQLITSISLPD